MAGISITSWWLGEKPMIENRRRATCAVCGKGSTVTVHADGFDDAPASFKVVIECDGACGKAYLPHTADQIRTIFGLPLTGWTEARY